MRQRINFVVGEKRQRRRGKSTIAAGKNIRVMPAQAGISIVCVMGIYGISACAEMTANTTLSTLSPSSRRCRCLSAAPPTTNNFRRW